MASIFIPKNSKSYKLQEVVNGERKTITLGRMSQKSAELIRSRVETINSCNEAGLPYPLDVAQWLGTIGDDLHKKLSTVGLVGARQAASLEQELEKYIKNHSGGKEPSTLEKWGYDRDRLVQFFGADRDTKTIIRSECEQYKTWLYNERHMADSTVGRAIRNARMFFTAWVRDGLLERNPFDGVKSSNAIRRPQLSH